MNSKHYATLTKLRGMFPEKLYLGGSMALKKFFYDTRHIEPSDMDVFYYGRRPMERHVLNVLLKSMGFKILVGGKKYNGIYTFLGQYWFIKLRDLQTGVVFDLIFIDERYLEDADIFGNDLAYIQYHITYADQMLQLSSDPTTRKVIDRIRKTQTVQVDISRNTEGHLEKTIARCNSLGLKVLAL